MAVRRKEKVAVRKVDYLLSYGSELDPMAMAALGAAVQ